MVQQLKLVAVKPDDLFSIPRSHMVIGEHSLPQLSSDLHMCTYTSTRRKKVKNVYKELKHCLVINRQTNKYKIINKMRKGQEVPTDIS